MIAGIETRGQGPFPFTAIFQNGPRPPGFAPPRKPRAPWTAPGRSENASLEKGMGANAKAKPQRKDPFPLDDVNNLEA